MVMIYSNTMAKQVTATGRKITAKWTKELETMTGVKPINIMKSERKGFKHQIKVNHHLNWVEVAKWMDHSFGPGGNRKTWSCDWASLYCYGKAHEEFEFRLKYTFNVYLTTDEQLSHFLLTWDAK